MGQLKKAVRMTVCILLAVCLTACSNFDAKGYTQALLDQMFQGESEPLLVYDKGNGKKELKEQYEEYIAVFSENLTEGLNTNEIMTEKFYKLCKEIFRMAKYNVKEAEKISSDEYKVSVEIRQMDVFVRWNEMLTESVADISAKVEKGEYEGTEEEILQFMLADITSQSYQLLETRYQEVQYGEPETIVLTIKKNGNEKFEAKDEEISELITKILCLDAIQD